MHPLSKHTTRHLKAYLTLAWPIFINLTSYAVIGLIDSSMVGWLDIAHAPTAADLANKISSIPILFSIGFSTILSAVVARSTNTNHFQKPAHLLKYTIIITTTVSTLIALPILFKIEAILTYWGQKQEIINIIPTYLKFISISAIFSAYYQPIKKYLEGLGWVRTNMILSFVGGGLNLSLNYLLMKGTPLWNGLGFEGIALATLITRFLMSIVYTSYAIWLHKTGYLPAATRKFSHKKLWKLSLPGGLELALNILYGIFMSHIILGKISTDLQDTGSLLTRTTQTLLHLPLSIAIASSILIGRHSRKKENAAQKQYHIGCIGYILATIAALLCALALPIALHILGPLYGYSPTIEQNAQQLFWYLLPSQLLISLQMLGVSLARGFQDTIAPLLYSLFAYTLIGIPLAYYLAFQKECGVPSVYIAMSASQAIIAPLLFLRFYKRTHPTPIPPQA